MFFKGLHVILVKQVSALKSLALWRNVTCKYKQTDRTTTVCFWGSAHQSITKANLHIHVHVADCSSTTQFCLSPTQTIQVHVWMMLTK